ncbi:hypothetical protein MJI12_27760, partial [Salmonella enterica subsp. enterica serovar Kentucky]|nr:hypothetical protein [Salmonella enterica subsp. enterica serovar Kentucky]
MAFQVSEHSARHLRHQNAVTIAVAHLVRRFLPGCNCETAYSQPVLLQQLRRKPEAILIL